jgi:hypothetical protein
MLRIYLLYSAVSCEIMLILLPNTSVFCYWLNSALDAQLPMLFVHYIAGVIIQLPKQQLRNSVYVLTHVSSLFCAFNINSVPKLSRFALS